MAGNSFTITFDGNPTGADGIFKRIGNDVEQLVRELSRATTQIDALLGRLRSVGDGRTQSSLGRQITDVASLTAHVGRLNAAYDRSARAASAIRGGAAQPGRATPHRTAAGGGEAWQEQDPLENLSTGLGAANRSAAGLRRLSELARQERTARLIRTFESSTGFAHGAVDLFKGAGNIASDGGRTRTVLDVLGITKALSEAGSAASKLGHGAEEVGSLAWRTTSVARRLAETPAGKLLRLALPGLGQVLAAKTIYDTARSKPIKGLFNKALAVGGSTLSGVELGAAGGGLIGGVFGEGVGAVPGAIIGGTVGGLGGLFVGLKAAMREPRRPAGGAINSSPNWLLDPFSQSLADNIQRAGQLSKQNVDAVVTQFKLLSPQMRKETATALRGQVQAMEAHKRVVSGTTRALVAAINKEWPQIEPESRRAVGNAIARMSAKLVDGRKALNPDALKLAQGIRTTMRGPFGGIVQDLGHVVTSLVSSATSGSHASSPGTSSSRPAARRPVLGPPVPQKISDANLAQRLTSPIPAFGVASMAHAGAHLTGDNVLATSSGAHALSNGGASVESTIHAQRELARSIRRASAQAQRTFDSATSTPEAIAAAIGSRTGKRTGLYAALDRARASHNRAAARTIKHQIAAGRQVYSGRVYDQLDATLALDDLALSGNPDNADLSDRKRKDLESYRGVLSADLAKAKKRNDYAAIQELASRLQSVGAAITDLTKATALQQQLTQARMDLDRELADNQKRLLAVAESQPNVLLGGLIAAVNGGIGGKVGLGVQTPAFAGQGVRY